MKKMGKYHATDTMRSLIKDNSQLLMVINRFGISLGFGEKSVEEIAKSKVLIPRPFWLLPTLLADTLKIQNIYQFHH